VNYKQIPVNAPKCPVDSYSKDGAMRIVNPADPVRVTNDNTRAVDGNMVRSAYTLRGDDDYGQARALIRDVMDEL
jgi:catalase